MDCNCLTIFFNAILQTVSSADENRPNEDKKNKSDKGIMIQPQPQRDLQNNLNMNIFNNEPFLTTAFI